MDLPLKCLRQSLSPILYMRLFHQFSFAKKLQTQTVRTEKLCEILPYEKAASKMLVKSKPCFLANAKLTAEPTKTGGQSRGMNSQL